MNITKRFLSILLFTAISVGAWAIEQDADGTYLIGSTDDWNDFASGINSGSIVVTANAKLTADIAVSTMIGSESKKYAGVFDGKTHTLNVTISGSSQFAAPFHYVNGGTIKNLRVEGTVSSSYVHMSGLIGRAYGKISIENCIVAANINMSSDYAAGFVGNGGSIAYGGPSEVVMRNCLFIGSFTGVSGNRANASAFWGWGKSTPVFINCLENGTYTNISDFSPYMYEGTDENNTETTTNSYYKHGTISLDGISNASNMTDGEIVSLLGDGWVLDPITNQPMLNLFASLKQDADGNYLIGSVQEWKDFTTLVETTPTANAKMTADIDLSTDVTMVGTESIPYQGTFDGQGHKLTVNWSVCGGGDGVAPFRYVSGATIQKLHVDGNISATGSEQRGAASIVAFSIGSTTTTINECWGSVSLTCYDTMGGLFSVAYETSTVNITDCLFSGTINPTHSGQGFSAGFASQAMKDGSKEPTINITRGLFLGSYDGSINYCYTFIRNDLPDEFGTHNITDCYYKDAYGTEQGTQVTSEELADGTTTSELQNNRTEKVWVQDGDQPMLAVFVSNNSGFTTGFIPIENGKSKMENEANGWYSISGQKLSGKPATKGIYIRDGKKMIVE